MYTEEQVKTYFRYISFEEKDPPKTLQYLKRLQRKQLVKIPFDSLALHYTPHHTLSLDYEDLYEKIVLREGGGGGYCMELNAFFGQMLRALGFDVMSVGARVSNQVAGGPKDRYQGHSHMANLVLLDGENYLVDVGFGAPNASVPLLLKDGHVEISAAVQFKLEYKTLDIHSRPSQGTWIYSSRFPNEKEWQEGYIFTEMEFFKEDFEIMSFWTSTHRSSFFVLNVICQRMVASEDGEGYDGQVMILGNELKRRHVDGSSEVLETFKTEEDRVRALEKWFYVKLTASQQRGIRGLATELKASTH